MITIFIDSDAFIALYSKNDIHHKKALNLAKKLKKEKTPLITSWDVIDETATKLSFYLTKKISLNFLKTIIQGRITLVSPDEEVLKKAIKIFAKQKSKRVSFTDCTNMAIAKTKEIKTFFSFDKHYLDNGFKLFSA